MTIIIKEGVVIEKPAGIELEIDDTIYPKGLQVVEGKRDYAPEVPAKSEICKEFFEDSEDLTRVYEGTEDQIKAMKWFASRILESYRLKKISR